MVDSMLKRITKRRTRPIAKNHKAPLRESPSPGERISGNSEVNKFRADLRDAVAGSMGWEAAAEACGCTKRMLLAIAAGTRSPSPKLRRTIRREIGV